MRVALFSLLNPFRVCVSVFFVGVISLMHPNHAYLPFKLRRNLSPLLSAFPSLDRFTEKERNRNDNDMWGLFFSTKPSDFGDQHYTKAHHLPCLRKLN